VEQAREAVHAAYAARDAADGALRGAVRQAEEAAEEVRRADWLIDRRRRSPDEGPTAVRHAELTAELRAEQRMVDQVDRERAARRREQLGPVNPLAKQEYDDAVAHVEELETQRRDLEAAMAELEGLIKETDQRIRESFESTFDAAARNFEDVVSHLFPGGRGRL